MLPSRERAEAALTLITTAVLAGCLTHGTSRGELHGEDSVSAGIYQVALLLVMLTAAAMWAESVAGASWGRLYCQRQAGSSGLALGALTLPWVFAGLAIRRHKQQFMQHAQLEQTGWQSGDPAAHPAAAASAILTAIAASAAALLLLLWLMQPPLPQRPKVGAASHTTPAQPNSKVSNGWGQQAAHGDTKPAPAQALQRWQGRACCAMLCWVLVASAVVEASAGGGWRGAIVLLAVAVAAACSTHLLLKLLPRVFTVGEAVVAAQAAALLCASALQQLPFAADNENSHGALDTAAGQYQVQEPYLRFVVLLTAGSVVAAALLIPLLLRYQPDHVAAGESQRRTRSSSGGNDGGLRNANSSSRNVWAAAALAVAGAAAAAVAPAALWAVQFALSSQRRLLLCCWWVANMAMALPAQHWINRSGRVPAILVRKGYHLLALSLFLPALLLEPQFLAVALAAAFVMLLAVEVLRLSALPGVAAPLHAFMTSFTDGRDSGLLLITHFTLLLGMAAPIWLSNALRSTAMGAVDALSVPGAAATAAANGAAESGGAVAGGSGVEAANAWAAAGGAGGAEAVWPAAYAGILIVGLGDTAASAVGSLFGRHPICRGCSKTLEGTSAAVATTLAGWALLAAGLGGPGGGHVGGLLGAAAGASWVQLAAATALSCVLEAVTTQLDNIFVPLHYFALLCLL